MSMVYRALRQMHAERVSGTSPLPRVEVAAVPRRWPLRVGVSLGALAGFVVALAVTLPRDGVAAVETVPLPEQTAATSRPTTPEPTPAGLHVTRSGADEITVAPAPVSSAIPMASAPEGLPPGALIRQEKPSRHGKSAPRDDDAEVSATVHAFSDAMQGGRSDDARRHLARLSSLLPAQSLTLLRMRAWYASETGAGDAEQLYLQILDRVPEDPNAGINLALVRDRHGDNAGARLLLDRIQARNPDLAALAAARRQVESGQP